MVFDLQCWVQGCMTEGYVVFDVQCWVQGCVTEGYVVFDVQCWVQSCVAEGQSLQNRTARCTAERNATYVSDSLCDVKAKPAVTRVCENPLCQPVWNTSEWSAVCQPRPCPLPFSS